MTRRPRTSRGASVLTLVSMPIAAWPFTAVVEGTGWMLPTTVLTVLLVAVGALARWGLDRRGTVLRVGVPVLAQLVTLTAAATVLFAPGTGWWGFVPTTPTVALFGEALTEAGKAVWTQSAPLTETPAVVMTLVVLLCLIGVAVNALLAERMAVTAACLVGITGVSPLVAARFELDLWWFLVYAVLVVLLLRRRRRAELRQPHRASWAMTAVVGAVAVAASALAAPHVPVLASGVGPAAQVILNPSLSLGDDLRQPQRFDVISLATEASQAPYLRIATLSRFDGGRWLTDEWPAQSLASGFGEGALPAEYETRTTSIRMQNVVGTWLPTPYAALAVSGLDESWQAMPTNRTIVSASTQASDQDYTVTAAVIEPAHEQLAAATAVWPMSTAYLALPEDTPASVGDLAREVTADQASDYERLLALQAWFRSTFTYSLTAPVEQRFDGSGAEAVGRFLEVRAGYCVHFASAFAMMARALEMPSRIVVGFLPGTPTGEKRGDENLFSVSSAQLHAWPEVHFDGWGWIPFEPTATLGTPTDFPPVTEGETEIEGPDPSAAPSETPTTAPSIDPSAGPEIAGPGDAGALAPPVARVWEAAAPIALTVLAVCAVALGPLLVRRWRRARRLARAARGEVAATWAEWEDTLIDLGIAVADADTPRLRAGRSAAAPAAGELAAAVERASYAASDASPENLGILLRRVIAELTAAAPPLVRWRALLLPRSLVPPLTRPAPTRD